MSMQMHTEQLAGATETNRDRDRKNENKINSVLHSEIFLKTRDCVYWFFVFFVLNAKVHVDWTDAK